MPQVTLSPTFLSDWKTKRFPVFLSFSGGSDSLVLFHLLHEQHKKFDLSLTAVHFEHGIRGIESLQDAEFCKRTSESFGIPFFCFPLDVMNHRLQGESIESAARRLRLETWEEMRKKQILPNNAVVVLAHHAGDIEENFFLRLMRGSNVSGLTSIRERRVINSIVFYRPLLAYTKQNLIDSLKLRNIDVWCHDKTNDSPECCARNFFRNSIIPQIHGKFEFSKTGIQKSLEALSCDADFIENAATSTYKQISHENILDLQQFKKVHHALVPRILRRFISEQMSKDFLPDNHFILRVFEILQNDKFSESIKIPVPSYSKIFMVFEKNSIYIQKENPTLSPEPEYTWTWKNNQKFVTKWGIFSAEIVPSFPKTDHSLNEAYFDADSFPNQLLIRTKKVGDTILLVGHGNPTKCKKVFTDAHICSNAQRNYPILISSIDNSILWIPRIKRSQYALVKKECKSILKISFFSNEKGPKSS